MSTTVASLVLSSWQVTLLRHITTFNIQPGDDALSSANKPTAEPTPSSKLGPTTSVSPTPSLPSDVAESSAPASSTTYQQGFLPSDDPEPLQFPDDGENYGLTINRAWVDTHGSLLRTDPGLYISVRGIKDVDKPERKRTMSDARQTTRFKAARTDIQADAATASHATSDPTSSVPLDTPFTPDIVDALTKRDPEEEEPEEAAMDDRKPDLSLIDLPPSGKLPREYLWRQCAIFMEIKRHASDGPLIEDAKNAGLPEDSVVENTRAMLISKSIITQMADNARILMAARPFLRFCLHIAFCGTTFNLVLLDRNGAIISRGYDFRIHLGLFIRIIRRLSREMTAYDLGLDTTVRPEGCLGSAHYPSYLVKILDDVWYRTEGVPLWQSTSLIGRGTLVFNAREHGEPNGPLWILKNAWREDGRLKESELYKLMQKSGGPFKPPKALAKFVVGGDVTLDGGRTVTIGGHRARFGSKVTKNGATTHRLVLASRGQSLASYTSLIQLLMAAVGIVIGMDLIIHSSKWLLIPLLAHKGLCGQGILHADLSYGNTFLSEATEDNVHGFLADLDLASISDNALNQLPEDIVETVKQQREKGPRSVCSHRRSSSKKLTTAFQGTLIFMAVELLHSQVRHLKAEIAARKGGRQGPPTLGTKREDYHDLEALLWVLVYTMMIHNYNTLTLEADRNEYKGVIDRFFGHGSADTILEKRHAMLSMVHSLFGDSAVSSWFSDPHEQKFFKRSIKLIADHNKKEEEEEVRRTFDGEIDDDNPAFWRSINKKKYKTPDEDADDTSGTYTQGRATSTSQKFVASSRKRPPVITHESVVAMLMQSIEELE